MRFIAITHDVRCIQQPWFRQTGQGAAIALRREHSFAKRCPMCSCWRTMRKAYLRSGGSGKRRSMSKCSGAPNASRAFSSAADQSTT